MDILDKKLKRHRYAGVNLFLFFGKPQKAREWGLIDLTPFLHVLSIDSKIIKSSRCLYYGHFEELESRLNICKALRATFSSRAQTGFQALGLPHLS
ncbi:MAG: hypothetical protein K4571_15110 [Deltaproteobacteria bacterium]